MALFKISKGLKANLPSTYTEGFCYFTTDDGKFYIDTNNTAAGRVALNADYADRLTVNGGSSNIPIYFSNGKPLAVSKIATNLLPMDTALSITSSNPVQNKVLSRLTSTLIPIGTSIGSNADLNTLDYIKVGNYYCSTNASAKTLINCPVEKAFMMQVYSPLSTTIDNENTSSWVYRLRRLTTLEGDIYQQFISSSSTAGVFTYQGWKKVVPLKLTDLDITATANELNYVDGVTSNIQTQLNNKAERFVLTVTGSGTSSSPYTANKTFANTLSAIEQGDSVILHFATFDFYPMEISSTHIRFTFQQLQGTDNLTSIDFIFKSDNSLEAISYSLPTGQTISDTYLTKVDPTGSGSLSIGRKIDTTIGNHSIALGVNAEASASEATSIGYHNVASGTGALATGGATTASGVYSFSGGTNSTASGDYSFATGQKCLASGFETFATGRRTEATGDYGSHAEGMETYAKGFTSHTEGYHTTTAEGTWMAHAEGSDTLAGGDQTHAEGTGTIAMGRSQHVQGEYNIEDTSTSTSERGTYAHIVGNGTDEDNRSNAHTLDWNGNAWFEGKVSSTGVESDGDVTLKVTSGDSPALIFQRGTFTDIYNDWRIQNQGGYLYFDQRGSSSTDWETKFHITQSGATFKNSVTAPTFSGALSGNASTATALTTNAGSVTQPVYFSGGKPVATTYTLSKSVPADAKFTDTTYSAATTSANGLMTAAMVTKLNGIAAGANAYTLPKASSSALGGIKVGSGLSIDSNGVLSAAAGMTEPLVLTENTSWGASKPADDSGTLGQLFFVEDEGGSLPKGGTSGQIIVKNSSEDGDASWQNFPSLNYLPLTGGTVTGAVSITDATASTSTSTGALKVSGGIGVAGDIYGNAVYGAVWNDYAEYRCGEAAIEPGYCVCSSDAGTVSKTTEKFQACDGIVSDTFGFAIGETDKCQIPLAVAGRVLAFYEGSRSDYHAGDTVCAGPDGRVCKMSRSEIREWPDRIVGIVSEIPDYEVWGSGNVAVGDRIWIKVR